MKAQTSIYFIAPVGGGLVKIGISIKPRSRLTQLRNSSPIPLEMLACAVGSTNDERKLHRIFLGAHVHGEWFRPIPEILDLAGRIAKAGAIPDEMRAAGREGNPLFKRSSGEKRTPETCANISKGIRAAWAKRLAHIEDCGRKYRAGVQQRAVA